jgi:hypothetical protein
VQGPSSGQTQHQRHDRGIPQFHLDLLVQCAGRVARLPRTLTHDSVWDVRRLQINRDLGLPIRIGSPPALPVLLTARPSATEPVSPCLPACRTDPRPARMRCYHSERGGSHTSRPMPGHRPQVHRQRAHPYRGALSAHPQTSRCPRPLGWCQNHRAWRRGGRWPWCRSYCRR